MRDAVSHVDYHYPRYFNETTVDGWYDQLSKSSDKSNKNDAVLEGVKDSNGPSYHHRTITHAHPSKNIHLTTINDVSADQ